MRHALFFAAISLFPLTAWSAADEIRLLWAPDAVLPKAAEMPVLEGLRFSVIKPYEFQKDGYRFLHGVALA